MRKITIILLAALTATALAIMEWDMGDSSSGAAPARATARNVPGEMSYTEGDPWPPVPAAVIARALPRTSAPQTVFAVRTPSSPRIDAVTRFGDGSSSSPRNELRSRLTPE